MSVTELRDVGRDLELETGTQERKDDLVERILERQTQRAGHDYATGILDIVDEGFGFMRRHGLLPSPDDVYVSSSQVRRFGLRIGDRVSGAVRAPRDAEKYWGMLRVDAVNGVDIDTARRRPVFGDLTPIHPDELINIEAIPNNLSQRLINLVNPLGKGQRALIVCPPKAGKTMLLKHIANGISTNYPDILLMVALIGERPGGGHRHAPQRQGRGHQLDVRRADGEPHPRRRDGPRDRQAAGRDRPRRRDPARLDHPPRPCLQPGPPAVRTHAFRWHRPDRPLPAEAVLRRRPEHRGGRLADDHRRPASSTPAPGWTT